jgi:hypothetical protein
MLSSLYAAQGGPLHFLHHDGIKAACHSAAFDEKEIMGRN